MVVGFSQSGRLKLHFFFLFMLKNYHLQALASTLDEEELADLKDQFDAIDVDKNGSISLEEMRQVGLHMMGFCNVDIHKVHVSASICSIFLI